MKSDSGKQKVIFRPWRIDPRTGEKLWAKRYGLKAWAIPVFEEK